MATAFTTLCNAGTNDPSTIDAIVAEAFARNPEIKGYEAEIAAARGERRTAAEWRNPEITADAGAKLVRDVPGGPDSNGVATISHFSHTAADCYSVAHFVRH